MMMMMVKGQRNTAQLKEQTRNTEVQINEEEICKLKNQFGVSRRTNSNHGLSEFLIQMMKEEIYIKTNKQTILKSMAYGLGHNTHLSLIMQYEFRECVN